MKKKIFSVLTICFVIMSLSLSAFAHGGRTDGSGGHKDNKNKSGLGGYHYHCGGYPAHLHKNGVCPYKGGGSSSYSSTPKTVYASSFTAKNVPSKINAGDTATLEASVYPSNAEDKTITWESSNSDILQVSGSGSLTAVGVGTATITAKTSRGTSKKFTITVTEVMAESISIVKDDADILLGESQYLKCEFTPENTTDKTVEWSSSDENIISVAANGEITANKLGVATITATHKELSNSIDIEVKPVDAKSVEIILPDDIETNDDGKPKLNKGSQLPLQAKVEPENTTFKDIKWTVSDEELATIDENGVLTAHSTGIVIVTATAKSGVSEEIEIEIYSNVGDTVTGIIGLAALGGGGTALYYRRKKKKSSEV